MKNFGLLLFVGIWITATIPWQYFGIKLRNLEHEAKYSGITGTSSELREKIQKANSRKRVFAWLWVGFAALALGFVVKAYVLKPLGI